MHFRPRVLTSIAAAIALFGAGCSSAAGEPDAKGSPGTPSTRPAAGEVVLPINSYLPTTEENLTLATARGTLIDKCMRRFGLTYTTSSTREDAEARLKDQGVYGNLRRYGIVDAKAAAEYGYHTASNVKRPDTQEAQERRRRLRQSMSSPAYQAVFNGSGKTTGENGTEIPEGGCAGEADRSLKSVGSKIDTFSYSKLVSEIKAKSFQQSMADPKVTAVFRQWSSCMAAKGYEAKTPMDELDGVDIESPRPTQREIQMATTDVECKKKTNLVEVWSGVEAKLQTSAIEKHFQELQMIKREHESRMKAIAQLMAGN